MARATIMVKCHLFCNLSMLVVNLLVGNSLTVSELLFYQTQMGMTSINYTSLKYVLPPSGKLRIPPIGPSSSPHTRRWLPDTPRILCG